MDIGQQLQLQQQINDLIKERESLLKKQAKLLTNQSKISQRMCKALSNCPPSDTTNRVKEMRDGLEDAAKHANKTKDEMEDIADSAEEAAEQSSGLGSSIAGVVTGAAGLLGVSSIFGKIGGAIQGVVGFPRQRCERDIDVWCVPPHVTLKNIGRTDRVCGQSPCGDRSA